MGIGNSCAEDECREFVRRWRDGQSKAPQQFIRSGNGIDTPSAGARPLRRAPMNRLHPPVHLLRAFLAVARLGSVSRAAESLHLTQGAVSKRIHELEDSVGVPLFERVRRRLVTTPAGARYEATLRPLLAQVEAATLELIASAGGGGALRLSTLPTFGAKWLIPRRPGSWRPTPGSNSNSCPTCRATTSAGPTWTAPSSTATAAGPARRPST
jgi:DNA-binding MarR family transcriptional regulator